MNLLTLSTPIFALKSSIIIMRYLDFVTFSTLYKSSQKLSISLSGLSEVEANTFMMIPFDLFLFSYINITCLNMEWNFVLINWCFYQEWFQHHIGGNCSYFQSGTQFRCPLLFFSIGPLYITNAYYIYL